MAQVGKDIQCYIGNSSLYHNVSLLVNILLEMNWVLWRTECEGVPFTKANGNVACSLLFCFLSLGYWEYMNRRWEYAGVENA